MNENDIIRKLENEEKVLVKDIITVIKMLKESAESWKKEYENLAYDIIKRCSVIKEAEERNQEEMERQYHSPLWTEDTLAEFDLTKCEMKMKSVPVKRKRRRRR